MIYENKFAIQGSLHATSVEPSINESINTSDPQFILSKFHDSQLDFRVHKLISASDNFLKRAHLLVLNVNHPLGAKDYFKLVKLSIKCLLIIIKDYKQHLNPRLELSIYLKLANIYLKETENLNRADDYINRAISIASRNKLTSIKFVCEILAGLVLEKSNSKILLKYWSDRIDWYKTQKALHFVNVLNLYKFKNLLLEDYSTGLIVLQSITNDPNFDGQLRLLCCLYQASLHLYRGSPKDCHRCLKSIDTPIGEQFPQLLAIKQLLEFQYFIHMNSFEKAKTTLKMLFDFINKQRANNWMHWREDGTFELGIEKKGNVTSDLKYGVTWLNSDEFILLYYMLSGVHFLSEMKSVNKSDKIFTACGGIIKQQLSELTGLVSTERNFPAYQVSAKIFRLKYFQLCITIYESWLEFMRNEYNKLYKLEEFMRDYRTGVLCPEEMCYYKLLVPNILHLLAMRSQVYGDFSAAKYYFLQLRQLFKINTHSSRISRMQLSLGIGAESFRPENEFSELYVYATLHLLVISTFELYGSRLEKEGASGLHLMISNLYNDLSTIFKSDAKQTSNTFTMNFAGSNEFLLATYRSIMLIFLGNDHKGLYDLLLQQLESLILTLPESVIHIRCLVLMVLFLNSKDSEKKLAHYDTLIRLVGEANTDNDKITTLFVLREMYARCVSTGDLDNANLVQLEIQTAIRQIGYKFKFLNC